MHQPAATCTQLPACFDVLMSSHARISALPQLADRQPPAACSPNLDPFVVNIIMYSSGSKAQRWGLLYAAAAVQVYEKKVAHLANYNRKDEQPGTPSHPSLNWSIPAG